jgi:anaerobic ribonucleoside-triphosphate reductase activating protein
MSASSNPLEGITFSGGEPFDQAAPLALIARKAREHNLGVMIFTGYAKNELQSSGDPGHQELMNSSDLVIAGPYEEGNPGNHPLLSSANQEFIFITERYRNILMSDNKRKAEFRIGTDGSVRISGFPNPV